MERRFGAISADLRIDSGRYRKVFGVDAGDDLPADFALGRIHPNPWVWALWVWAHARPIRAGDELHPSVRRRVEATANDPHPYHPRLTGRRE